MLDCYSEQDAGISDFEEQDSGSNHFKRTRMSINGNE